MAQRAWSLLAADLMKKYPYSEILEELETESQQTNFNIYRYVQTKLS